MPYNNYYDLLCKMNWHMPGGTSITKFEKSPQEAPSLKNNQQSKKTSLMKIVEILKKYLPIIKTVPTAIPPPKKSNITFWSHAVVKVLMRSNNKNSMNNVTYVVVHRRHSGRYQKLIVMKRRLCSRRINGATSRTFLFETGRHFDFLRLFI